MNRMHLAIAAALSAAVALSAPPAVASDVSAAKKKVRTHKVAPPVTTAWRWRPADPSFDQNGRLYRPPPGLPCPIDLGYGRWTSCTWR